MNGKEKCRALKEIRRQIAEKNDIPYAVSQCTHQGNCKGTCPKCEAELRYLENRGAAFGILQNQSWLFGKVSERPWQSPESLWPHLAG